MPTLSIAGAESRDALRRLNQFALYEEGMDPGADGIIDWGESIDDYLGRPDHVGLVIAAAEALVGLSLIKTNRPHTGPDGVTPTRANIMEQFYILRPWRRKGIGAEAARMILYRYPGDWVITTWPSEERVGFWRHVTCCIQGASSQEYCPGEHHGFPGQFVWVVRTVRLDE